MRKDKTEKTETQSHPVQTEGRIGDGGKAEIGRKVRFCSGTTAPTEPIVPAGLSDHLIQHYTLRNTAIEQLRRWKEEREKGGGKAAMDSF